jgi:hypothetical protein
MLFLKFMLLAICFSFLACAAGMVLYDIYLAFELDRILRRGERPSDAPDREAPRTPARVERRPPHTIRWNAAAKLLCIGTVSGLVGGSILVVPDGMADLRVSQISGVRPGALYPGAHVIFPLVDRVALYDIRDRVFATAAFELRGEKL